MAQNAELADRVRRADELARELQASRQRLATAREVERRRLVVELGHATTDRMAGLRGAVTEARADLAEPAVDPEAAQAALERARVGLDELLDRFRVIARGVYPSVLRDQGPVAALDEMATDLPRPVRLTASLAGRLDWEIESGVYFVVAAAMGVLTARRRRRCHRDPGRPGIPQTSRAAAVASPTIRDGLADAPEQSIGRPSPAEPAPTEEPPSDDPGRARPPSGRNSYRLPGYRARELRRGPLAGLLAGDRAVPRHRAPPLPSTTRQAPYHLSVRARRRIAAHRCVRRPPAWILLPEGDNANYAEIETVLLIIVVKKTRGAQR